MIQQTEPHAAARPERLRIQADAPLKRQQQTRRPDFLSASPDWINILGEIAMRQLMPLAFAVAIALSVVGAESALAAPADAPYCYKNTAPTHDMAGEYYAPDIPAAIAVNECGGVQIVWDNDTGRHNAFYGAVDRIPGGGFIAKADEATDGIFPNGANLIGIKPAERGTIQLFTTDSNRNITGVFKLTKMR
jgi:hypothetical protein